MIRRDFPYTGDDLRRIADRVDEILGTLPLDEDGEIPEGSWLWDARIDVRDPETPDWEPVGQIRAHGDGWLGFYPHPLDEEDK